MTPWVGSTVLFAFQIMTANDNPSRDPTSYALYGTNDAIVSADNSNGDKENWALIASGNLALTHRSKRSRPARHVRQLKTVRFLSTGVPDLARRLGDRLHADR